MKGSTYYDNNVRKVKDNNFNRNINLEQYELYSYQGKFKEIFFFKYYNHIFYIKK